MKFSTWGNGKSLLEQFTLSFGAKLLLTAFVLGTLFTIGNVLRGKKVKEYLPAFAGIFALAVLVPSDQRGVHTEPLPGMGVFRTGDWIADRKYRRSSQLAEAGGTDRVLYQGRSGNHGIFRTVLEYCKLRLYGLGIAWLVTPIVIIFMWFLGTRVFKIDNKPFVITLAAATSVCGTSAAIATGAASRAKKSDLSVTVSISIIFTVLMMVFEPVLIRVSGIGELMGGALIGGTVDSTGAVAVAGTALGETAQTAAVLVKSIQNILIGFIAFAVAVFFTTHEKNADGTKQKVTIAEVWYRLPKFILGFFAASLIASFVVVPLADKDAVSGINTVLDQYKNWAFVLAFTSIGLDTNFREIKEQMVGGKAMALYIIGQTFNIVLTFAVVYLLLSGKFFPLPTLD